MMESRSSPSTPIRQFFEDAFQERINRSPETLAALGIRRASDRLDDRSEAGLAADRDLVLDQLQRLARFEFSSLNRADQLSCRIFRREAERVLERYHYRFHDYLVNQKFGLHTEFPAFMINLHAIASAEDARSYIARLHAFDQCCSQVIAGLARREEFGVILPAFLLPQVIGDCRDFRGERDARPEENLLYADFSAKLGKLEGLTEEHRQGLLGELKQALLRSVIPAYERLGAFLERQQCVAPAEGGAATLPCGADFYRMCLAEHTTTKLSAGQIHQLGLDKVASVQQDMMALKERIGFRGSLRDFFAFVQCKPEFYYPQTSAGRQRYLDDMQGIISRIAPRLPELFTQLPQDELKVKVVERHRERTAGIAFYEGPAADGSRPGIFYVNLYDMRQMPAFTMEALAYHEALPGHHMQFSIANRLQELPSFRRHVNYTAYVEGWGLYSERIAKELGLYQDPYSEFGRLAQELKRAGRLVADTGIHAHGWTRQQAIDYLCATLPLSLPHVIKEVERYIVMPGQATSYMVGMTELVKLRRRRVASLGEEFDLREFHDALLRHGPLPLDLLEEQMAACARQGQ
jgi:uncharacterized protein (DUF885 family)